MNPEVKLITPLTLTGIRALWFKMESMDKDAVECINYMVLSKDKYNI